MRRSDRRVHPPVDVLVVPSRRELALRLPRLAIGIAMLGAGIAFMVRARLGLSPWDVLHQGIARVSGIDFGTVVILVGVVVLVLWVPLRQRPGLGTLLNTLLVGAVADGVLAVVPAPGSLVWRAPLLVGGVLVVGLGTGLYIGAGLGPGPRDGLMTGIAARGAPTWLVRMGLEVTALLVGWLLGGNVGVGTLLFAFAIGPLAHLFLGRFKVLASTDPAASLGVGPGVSGD